jgi:hypothetical protein
MLYNFVNKKSRKLYHIRISDQINLIRLECKAFLDSKSLQEIKEITQLLNVIIASEIVDFILSTLINCFKILTHF